MGAPLKHFTRGETAMLTILGAVLAATLLFAGLLAMPSLRQIKALRASLRQSRFGQRFGDTSGPFWVKPRL